MKEFEYCVEDIIISIYNTEVLLKQIKERQIRNCLYNWKYKTELTRELTIQKRKYNKYMLDGFYALARQTQSICMLFHIIKLNEYKIKKFALFKLILNMKDEINESSIDENTVLEFHENILKIIYGINKINSIFQSKLNKLLYSSFYLILYNCKYKINKLIENTKTVNKLDFIQIENLTIVEESETNSSYLTQNELKVNNSDKENKANNYEFIKLNNGFYPNKLQNNNITKNQFYTRKQNISFNNGYINSSIDNQSNSCKINQMMNSNELSSYANPLIYSLKSSTNENQNSSNRSIYNNISNTNSINPILNRQNAFNSNLNSYQNTIQSPLNTNKYSMENLFYSTNSVNKKNEFTQNFYLKKYSNEKKSPRSVDLSKSILNPCINFTQDSSNIFNNITDSFKSVIMN